MAIIWMTGACAIFFMILQVFHKIITLTMQEKEKIILADQIREQRIYLQEAKKRNEQYRAFQHDIDNHFLILTGLLHEKNTMEVAKAMEMDKRMDAGNCIPEYGTGLKNIRQTVKKYEGTMEIEAGRGQFRLTMLLCLAPFTK